MILDSNTQTYAGTSIFAACSLNIVCVRHNIQLSLNANYWGVPMQKGYCFDLLLVEHTWVATCVKEGTGPHGPLV